MVMTFKPSDAQLDARHTGDTAPQLPPSAPLIYFQDRPSPASQSSQFRQMSHFVADYGDRRAQAKYASEHQDAAQILGPTPSFRSRWGDPNNPATNGSSGLKGMITGQADNGKRNGKKQRKADKRQEKRENKGPGLIGGLKGMVTENAGMKPNQGLIKGVKNMGMQTVSPVLILVLSETNRYRTFSIS